MRQNTFSDGGNPSTALAPGGATGNLKLYMPAAPGSDLEAATRGYVEQHTATIDVSQITHGYLLKDILPEFSGDIVKPAGSNYLALTEVNTYPGLWSKVGVTSSGRAIWGGQLVGADIPMMSWDKIRPSSLPVTIDGYGIANALSTSGGAMTGMLSIEVGAISDSSILSPQLVETLVGDGTNITGEVVYKTVAETPVGFLRPNGGLVSKTVYSDLYRVFGDRYDPSGVPVVAKGQPWSDQRIFNMHQRKPLAGWTESAVTLPAAIARFQTAVLKNRLYVFGGKPAVGLPDGEIHCIPLSPNGTLGGSWETAGALPGVYHSGTVFVIGDVLYYLEGERDGVSNPTTLYQCGVNPDGTLTSWVNLGDLPTAVKGFGLLVTHSKVYLIGGYIINPITYSKAAISTIYSADILPDHSLSSWTLDGAIPSPKYGFAVVNAGSMVHLVAGRASATAPLSVIHSAPIDDNGVLGSWTLSGSQYPIAASGIRVVSSRSTAYLIGGNTGNGMSSIPTAAVYSATIAVDGSLGPWVANTSLPKGIAHGALAACYSHLYLLGGETSLSLGSASIYSTAFEGGCNDYIEDSLNWRYTPGPNFYLPDIPQTDSRLYPYVKY